MKLLLDQGVPRSAVDGLGDSPLTLRAEHVSDLGMSTATDPAIIEYARQNDLVIVTLDADFHALLALGHAKRPSVIRIREQGLDGAAFCGLMQAIWPDIAEAAGAGALITVTETRIRIRRLPVSGVSSKT